MKKKRNNKNKILEPEVQYQSLSGVTDSIAITFGDHQKESEELLVYQAHLSAEERLHQLYQLICISFGLNSEELRNPKLNNIIIIENPDEHFSRVA
jgi:hypothetical protein